MKDDPAKKAGKRGKVAKRGSQRQPVSDAGEWITKAQAARVRGVTRQAIAILRCVYSDATTSMRCVC